MNKDSIARVNLDFGNAMLLYAKSKLHCSWSIDMASRYVLPAILSGQYKVVKDADGRPLAYVSWARFDLRREVLYLEDPHSITPEDWNCGDRLWFIDWVSPMDKRITDELYTYLTHQVFPNAVARSLRIKPGEDKAKIKSYGGVNVSSIERRSILLRYYEELKNFLGGRQSKIVF